MFGYYAVSNFEPERWKAGYPNPAFSRMSERDAAWMARIIAEFDDEHLRVLVQQGRMAEPALEAELLRLLKGRRDRILERYLTRLSALTLPKIRSGTEADLCLRDLVEASGLRRGHERRHAVLAYVDESGSSRPLTPVRKAVGHRVCATLPRLAGAGPQTPKYMVVDWVAQSGSFPAELPARIHLYDLGPQGLQIVGLERPDSFEQPRVSSFWN